MTVKPFRETMLDLRRIVIMRALAATGGNLSEAARQLGVHRNTMDRLCRVVQIDTVRFRQDLQTAVPRADGTAKFQRYALRLPPHRYRMPTDRSGITHKFTVADVRGYITVNCFDDGLPGEVFLRMDKVGSTAHGLLDAFSIAFSMLLQQGTPLRDLVEKFRATRFEPAGMARSKEIPIVTSVLDYVVRWMELRFLQEERLAASAD